ncbi:MULTISPECIES: GNAT family N-acetyltransferase [unclassified Mesorhizobium]|uniref:GNAT family N-acetyltransferase n=1 Tax=unclassified Mesorhizobium TaxID=325217 RepID=UPI000F754BE1|nr:MULTISPECIES: GNAT family N-acetyltransferase [unclassified Mesorhizobium]TGT56705.1 GNAT family N-acetyltransferase [Mesorhizobium sp. M00.F.Ca.ET.170.01.1.1]AZO11755.1 GNAT family N-acetyltransferase [Mesorhizobium sp. M3A.F.Ca.ET.080.04.2.1]RWB72610.1 MAG: GNAT family N-acetyltransferase [Mesorhizobium sp.]RWB87119.1 MAG: GNAT family N-acetyltransferase [Mesorhizobium sp.]RWE36789.1 MAG: GNAT family N-acetyltransferase [Mesorhizobium sp.]
MLREIRTLTASEVETLVDWAAGEGWNPGIDDAGLFRAADPEGFIGAFVAGEMVAGISAVAYGAGFGFIGLYICRPGNRGQGHGKAVWDAGMTRLGGRIIGLDGVAEQRAKYQRMGFVPAYETVRYSGRPDGLIRGADIRPATPESYAAIQAYDRQCFPAPRRVFLEGWLRAPRMALIASDRTGIAGYGVARRCRDGFKIGPLFADGTEVALGLLAELAESVEGETLHVDVPASNGGLIAALESAGMRPGFTTTRMYKGGTPDNVAAKVFGITTLELG